MANDTTTLGVEPSSSSTEVESKFVRGFKDFLFGRINVDGTSNFDLNQVLVTAGTAVGGFFLGKKLLKKIWEKKANA